MPLYPRTLDARGSAWLLCSEAEKPSALPHVLNNLFRLLKASECGDLVGHPAETYIDEVYQTISEQLTAHYPRVSKEKAIASVIAYLRVRAVRRVHPSKGRALKFIQGLTQRFAAA